MITIERHQGVTCAKLVTARERGMAVYVYLVDGTLIDTGPIVLLNDLISFYETHHFNSVILTHCHEDHSGTASWIEQNKQVPIFIHPLGIPICEKRGDYPLYRRVAWGVRDEFHPAPLGDKVKIGDIMWDVIHTPGHADDHVCLYDKNSGRLFSGDMYIHSEIKVMLDTEDISVMMNSTRKLLQLDFEHMYCAHSGYLENGKKYLEKRLDNLQGLFDSVAELYKRGYSVNEIDQTLFPKKYLIMKQSEGEYDTLHIVTSVIKNIKKQASINK